MPNWSGIAGGLAGAGRGYEASQGRNIPGPSQPQQKNGLLMNYLRRKQVNQQMPAGSPAGLPPGATPDPMQISGNVGPPPSVPPNPNAAKSMQPPMPMPMGSSVPQNGYDEPEMGIRNRFAGGQVVDKPTTALLGEDGPEAVIPLTGRPDARVSTANMPQMSYRRGGC